ncbi:Uncharacterised protein [Streptococcus massiliensis]|uniref:Uncharacterized protein n=1 Tax=Streptococcus massiliensis TaxID=313439 RepID=A0A380KYI4_9STRE|nr:Uncharacterised protein [Streptococcus massiliensis]
MRQFKISNHKIVEVSPQADLTIKNFRFKKKSRLLEKISQLLLTGRIT